MNIDFYDKASDYMLKSWQSWENGEIAKSWGYTIPARLAYLCQTIISIVLLPFEIIRITFASMVALFTWNRKAKIFQTALAGIIKTTNRLILSALGSTISPAMTHKYRTANVAYFVVAARVVVISAGFLYWLFKK